MLDYNEITPKKVIVFEREPYEVLESHVFRKQQRKPVNATKLRNLLTGKVMEYSFHQSEKVDEAEVSKQSAKYLYANRGEYWFCEPSDPSKRFALKEDVIGARGKFLKPNSTIALLKFDEKLVGVEIPIKVELKVKEAPPGVKGDSSRGGMKQITLETGVVVNAPLFVNEGDTVIINTESGDYVERK